MPVSDLIALALGLAALTAGAFALRRAWSAPRKAPGRRIWVAGGWALLLAGLVLFAVAYGVERGAALALCAGSLIALGFVAAGLTRRPERSVRDRSALDPSDRRSRVWRGAVRAALAGPVSGLAAIGVGLAVAVQAPMAEADRLILGGSLVPVLWAAGIAWTLSDNRILRAGAVLLATGAAGFAIGMA